MSARATSGGARGGWFRGDLDGLRAVAMAVIVGYHTRLPGFDGTFISLDVFFVISGYLITRKLVTEVERSDRIDLLKFWGRRIRRLVPALGLMLISVLGLAVLIESPVRWSSAATQARAAALYVSNFYYAAQPHGYFGVDLRSSLFLNTWSLGVEEQFYLLWPLLFLAVGVLSAGRARRRRWLFGVALSILFVASLITSQILAHNGSTHAYFSLPSRAWQFAAAGLFALVTVPDWLRRPRVQTAMVAAGFGAMALAALLYTTSDPYPGYRGLLPVGGAILVLAGGETQLGGGVNPLSRLLAVRPLQWLGRLSYSWYLWHWPFIILATELLDSDTLKVRMAGAVASLGVATVAHYLVENPLRFSPRIATSRRFTYAGAAAITVATLITTVVVTKGGEHIVDTDPLLVAIHDAPKHKAFSVPCGATSTAQNGQKYCVDGDLQGDRTVVLFGDSFAGQWRVAFSDAAKAEGIRLVTVTEPGCPPGHFPVTTTFPSPETCDRFQARAPEAIAELKPDLVVVADGPSYASGQQGAQAWAASYQQMVQGLRATGTEVAAIVPNPTLGSAKGVVGMPTCLADKRSAGACSLPRSTALDHPAVRAAEAYMQAQLDIPVLDVTVPELCDADSCVFLVDGDVVVLADPTHLTVPYTQRHVGDIQQLFRQLVPAGAP